jgi:pyrroloquinoline quinone biosynthesis protein B
MVREDLTTGNPLFNILDHYCTVDWRRLPTGEGESFAIDGIDGLRISAIPLASKAPPYSPHRDDPHEGDNVGLHVVDTRSGRSLFYAPGLGEIEPRVAACLRTADAVMVDGTFWTDDEMIRLGVSKKRARDIGHLPQSGAGGMIEVLKPLRASRKILIHINNTNPILDESSPERAQLDAAGIEVAYDGMELEL